MNLNNGVYASQQVPTGMMQNPNFFNNLSVRSTATTRTSIEQPSPESLRQNMTMPFPTSEPTNASMMPGGFNTTSKRIHPFNSLAFFVKSLPGLQ